MLSVKVVFLVIFAAKESKNDDKDVDNVKVKLQGSKDVFLLTQLMLLATNQHLCVVGKELKTTKQVSMSFFKLQQSSLYSLSRIHQYRLKSFF